LGGSITISLGISMSTSFGSATVSASNAGTPGVLDDQLLSTGTASVDNSGAFDIRSGSSASGLGSSIAISVGSASTLEGRPA
jgi:hypothetical protein